MNKKRREQLNKAITLIESARGELGPALDASEHNTLEEDSRAIQAFDKLVDEAKGILTECKDEEQDYLDNMPEAMQNGAKGDAVQDAVDNIDNAITALEDFNSNGDEVGDIDSKLEEAIDYINEATA